MNPAVVMAIIIIMAIAVPLIGTYPMWQEVSKPEPARLSFEVRPFNVVALTSSEIMLDVKNEGGDATDVTPVLVSDALLPSSVQSVRVRRGETVRIALKITGQDVQYGEKTADIRLQYSDASGDSETTSKRVSFYLLPSVELFEIGWQTDLLHPLGKNNIGKTDSTALHFRVHSGSKSIIYSGLLVKVWPSMQVPGLTLSPNLTPIESIGPDGRTGSYSVSISSSNSPPGKYKIGITLLTSDNKPIMQQSVELVISG